MTHKVAPPPEAPKMTFAPPEEQWQAAIQFAHDYRCPGCVPDVLIGLGDDGYANVDVYHEEGCETGDEELAEDATRQAQAVADKLDRPVLLVTPEEVNV